MITNVLTYLQDAYASCPDKIAFSDANSTLTYRQLWERARRAGTSALEKIPLVLLPSFLWFRQAVFMYPSTFLYLIPD